MKSTRPAVAPTAPAGRPRRRRKWLSANARVSLSIPGRARRPRWAARRRERPGSRGHRGPARGVCPAPAGGLPPPCFLKGEGKRKYLLQLLPEQTLSRDRPLPSSLPAGAKTARHRLSEPAIGPARQSGIKRMRPQFPPEDESRRAGSWAHAHSSLRPSFCAGARAAHSCSAATGPSGV